jgi:cytoplasmic iron level regulating protein YaaA (DUF328/UPF0246 family)
VLILLPPSEGKKAPVDGAPVDLATLVHADALTAQREKTLTALQRVAKGPRTKALAALGLSAGQAAEIERDRSLGDAPAAPAAEVYTGVLFQHLDLATLPDGARRRAGEQVLIASALWGVVRLDDRIPAYRLSMGAKLAALRRPLATAWRPALERALPDDEGDLVLDLRSGSYAAAWKPRNATVVEVRASTAEGQPISHMAKAVRGAVARRVLESRSSPRDPAAVAELAERTRAGRVELHAPGRTGGAWVVQVVAKAA